MKRNVIVWNFERSRDKTMTNIKLVPLKSLVRFTVTSKTTNVNYKGMSSPFKFSCCSQPIASFVDEW